MIAIRLYTWLRFTVCDSDQAVHLAEVPLYMIANRLYTWLRFTVL